MNTEQRDNVALFLLGITLMFVGLWLLFGVAASITVVGIALLWVAAR